MTKMDKQKQLINKQDRVLDSSVRETGKVVDGCDVTDIFCNGKCESCPQRKWCLLTPVFGYVK